LEKKGKLYYIRQCKTNYERSNNDCTSITPTVSTIREIFFYPNPSDGNLIIPFLAGKSTQFEVFNLFGNKIGQIVLNGDNLDLTHLNAGMYFLKVKIDAKINILKVIIQK
jgi:hypothetical protein